MTKAQIIEELSRAKPFTPDKEYRKLIAGYLDSYEQAIKADIANELDKIIETLQEAL